MVVIYIRRINEKLMTIDEVPARWNESVRVKLENQTTVAS